MAVKLDLRGLEEVATSADVKREISELAEQVADLVRAQGVRVEGEPGDVALPVSVGSAITRSMRVNRAKSWVNLEHAAGQAVQAKNGVLTKAAAQAGLKVKTKGR